MAGLAAETTSGLHRDVALAKHPGRRFREAWKGFQAVLRAVIGAPDYERYLEHVLRAHPGECPLTREQFAARQLDRRYNRVGGRCC